MTSRLSAEFIAIRVSRSDFFSSIFVFKQPSCLLHPTKAIRLFLFFSNNLYIGLPMEISPFQASRIITLHFGCVTHFSSNLLGIFFLASYLCISISCEHYWIMIRIRCLKMNNIVAWKQSPPLNCSTCCVQPFLNKYFSRPTITPCKFILIETKINLITLQQYIVKLLHLSYWP